MKTIEQILEVIKLNAYSGTPENIQAIVELVNEAQNQALPQAAVSGSLLCWLKDSAEDEKVLVRESKNGLKYLIFDNETISYGRVGENIGEYDVIHFNGTNGKSIL